MADIEIEEADYAAHHFYAQGQQWVPESELVAANKEIERLRASEWSLLAELWAIADLRTADLSRGSDLALQALERYNRATGGEVWRRFAPLEEHKASPGAACRTTARVDPSNPRAI
jgi:hypothetical protein